VIGLATAISPTAACASDDLSFDQLPGNIDMLIGRNGGFSSADITEVGRLPGVERSGGLTMLYSIAVSVPGRRRLDGTILMVVQPVMASDIIVIRSGGLEQPGGVLLDGQTATRLEVQAGDRLAFGRQARSVEGVLTGIVDLPGTDEFRGGSPLAVVAPELAEQLVPTASFDSIAVRLHRDASAAAVAEAVARSFPAGVAVTFSTKWEKR
jgi:hypothetical protein